MAATPDISAILQALAQQQQSQTPAQAPPPAAPAHQPPPPGLPAGLPGALQNPTPPAIPGFPLPQPTSTGTVDIGAIRPVSTGTVNIQDALAKARGFAADKGLSSYNGSRSAATEDPRLSGRSYRRSRSRSRSPVRHSNVRDSYNPYRDERREDPRRGGIGYGRDRSRSPRGRHTFSPPRGMGGRDRTPPPSDNSEIILIESSLVGLVIGRQGESLRRIEQESGTRIQFINGPDSGPQRQCRITGNPSARITAKREINRIIEENGGNPARETGRGARGGAAAKSLPALREGEQSSQIMVPDRTVGLIIGRGGETIRDLQERSGCHVNIVGESKSVNGLRPVNLIGSPAAAARAKELIMEIVDSDTKVGEGPGQPAPRRDLDPYSTGPGKITESIYVPSEAVGMIIGKGGETIKEMQHTTGCKINVSQASGADIEREIGLVGTRQAIDDAKKAIWDKVESVAQKDRQGGGPGRRGGRDGAGYGDAYSHQQQPAYGQAHAGAQGAAPAQGNVAADPYAPYGGYENYLAMWYSSLAAQQQQPGGQGGQPPGSA
ncbi:uncharacterized protein EI97DRAFT_34048 [Westerdykella ornata]|uniref:K Homology domain-containing protein n=1 Tax=Westerdykella ornata TaxID=318751 RepID=A0A6A6JY93_WESOR|nr:uncharacterized protein EI97DRAFT_34048 [Westerdykella ornata]KAF2281590.1 hypothetical protein EI97DRAFT_34048 [Westerdykella ornata]